ncbi:hypothetical protein J1N35_038684, partial [Gossypium stocksii]
SSSSQPPSSTAVTPPPPTSTGENTLSSQTHQHPNPGSFNYALANPKGDSLLGIARSTESNTQTQAALTMQKYPMSSSTPSSSARGVGSTNSAAPRRNSKPPKYSKFISKSFQLASQSSSHDGSCSLAAFVGKAPLKVMFYNSVCGKMLYSGVCEKSAAKVPPVSIRDLLVEDRDESRSF